MQEEIFGPVTCVTVFDTEAEVVVSVVDKDYVARRVGEGVRKVRENNVLEEERSDKVEVMVKFKRR